MAKRYEVVLVKPLPTLLDSYPVHFFPRGFHYHRDAHILAEEVRRKGGEATVQLVVKPKGGRAYG